MASESTIRSAECIWPEADSVAVTKTDAAPSLVTIKQTIDLGGDLKDAIVVDNFDLEAFTAVAARHGQNRYSFAVTPNVDHLIRYHEDPSYRAHYHAAGYVLMDSRVVRLLVRLLKDIRLPICTGSDLTVTLLSRVAGPTDRIVMLGGTARQAQHLTALYGLKNVQHHNPPMGFVNDPDAVEDCLQFIERASPFRFCFLAVGSPQQELIAHQLKTRGVARGFAICVGASINYITGSERRAPAWIQRLALEWLYRLVQNPQRLARRYLLRGPRIFRYLLRARIVLREPRSDLP
ncbi:MAG TPA: WecB/TagA/CpsF family glycosyltransferase [Steroidobacteraceae bacterium]